MNARRAGTSIDYHEPWPCGNCAEILTVAGARSEPVYPYARPRPEPAQRGGSGLLTRIERAVHFVARNVAHSLPQRANHAQVVAYNPLKWRGYFRMTRMRPLLPGM